jgi:hypothetical protein
MGLMGKALAGWPGLFRSVLIIDGCAELFCSGDLSCFQRFEGNVVLTDWRSFVGWRRMPVFRRAVSVSRQAGSLKPIPAQRQKRRQKATKCRSLWDDNQDTEARVFCDEILGLADYPGRACWS